MSWKSFVGRIAYYSLYLVGAALAILGILADKFEIGTSGFGASQIMAVLFGVGIVGFGLLLRSALEGHLGARVAVLRTLLVGASLAFSLVTAEVLLRVSQISAYPHGFWRIDAKTGLIGGVAGYRGVRNSEFGKVKIITNEFGFRGPVFNGRNDGRKVLILGDSFVHANQVAYEDTFGAILEAGSSDQLQVMQVGVPGWGQGDQFRWCSEIGVKLNPDVVVVVVFLGNDLTVDNMNPENLGSNTFRVTKDGYLITRKSETRAEWWLSLSDFALYREAYAVMANYGGTSASGRIRREDASVELFSIPEYYQRFLPLYRLGNRHADVYDTFFNLVQMFDELSREGRFDLIFVTIPWCDALSDERFQRVLDEFSLPFKQYDRTSPHAILGEFFERMQIAHIDLSVVFQSHGDPLEAYGRRDPHLSPAGHRWVAEALWRSLDGR